MSLHTNISIDVKSSFPSPHFDSYSTVSCNHVPPLCAPSHNYTTLTVSLSRRSIWVCVTKTGVLTPMTQMYTVGEIGSMPKEFTFGTRGKMHILWNRVCVLKCRKSQLLIEASCSLLPQTLFVELTPCTFWESSTLPGPLWTSQRLSEGQGHSIHPCIHYL